MRAFVVFTITAALVSVPSVAGADGGAYINLDETYYVAGDTAVATAYVAIPKSKRSLLDRGPFYAYVLGDRSAIRAGAPVPPSAVRVGQFDVHFEDGSFEFEARFTLPSLPFGWNNLGFCNEPCTIAGFREPLSGAFFVVATEREAELLVQNGRLRGQLAGAQRDAAEAERELAAAREDLAQADREATAWLGEILRLENQLAATSADAARARSRSDTERRAALIVAVELALGAAAVALIRRTRRKRATAPGDLAVT